MRISDWSSDVCSSDLTYPGDPLRWSPVAVEILLLDWVPRKIVADRAYLESVPAVLRALVTYAHAERAVAAARTRATLGAIDDMEAEYLDAISRPRRPGPEALLEQMGLLRPLDDDADADAG